MFKICKLNTHSDFFFVIWKFILLPFHQCYKEHEWVAHILEKKVNSPYFVRKCIIKLEKHIWQPVRFTGELPGTGNLTGELPGTENLTGELPGKGKRNFSYKDTSVMRTLYVSVDCHNACMQHY